MRWVAWMVGAPRAKPWGAGGEGQGGAYMSCFPVRPHGILPFLCRK